MNRHGGHVYDITTIINPISGRLLATPISGRGLLATPLISRDLKGRFLKFKRHSIPLNVIYILKKENLKI